MDEDKNVVCPVCGCDPIEKECAHLVFHGDDLRTRDVVLESSGREVLGELERDARHFVPEFASEFFEEFGKCFPTFVSCDRVLWEGVPGCSGAYQYVWARGRARLLNDIFRFLRKKLDELRQKRAKAGLPPVRKRTSRAGVRPRK